MAKEVKNDQEKRLIKKTYYCPDCGSTMKLEYRRSFVEPFEAQVVFCCPGQCAEDHFGDRHHALPKYCLPVSVLGTDPWPVFEEAVLQMDL